MTTETTMKGAKKLIQFETEINLCVFHAGAVMDMESACQRDIWFQQTDLGHIKRKAMVISKEANRYGLGSLLTNTYGKTDAATQEALNTWTRNGHSRRGLERWINNEYAAKRADIRRRTIQSVLRAQIKMAEEGIQDIDYKMKVLSRLSEAFSQDSRNFARVMGLADQLACTEAWDSNTILSEETKLVTERKMPIRMSSPTSVMMTPIGGGKLSSRRGTVGYNVARTTSAGDMRHYC